MERYLSRNSDAAELQSNIMIPLSALSKNIGLTKSRSSRLQMNGAKCTVSLFFNTVSGKSHILQGWDESELISLYIITVFATMPKGYTSSITSVHFMNYHFVWCPKYRRKVIVADVESRLQEIIRDTAKENGWGIIALETMPDHVHLCIKADPTVAPNNVIARIKGRSSRILRNEFPSLRKRLPTLWTRSYFVSTHGHVSSEIIKKYVGEQEST